MCFPRCDSVGLEWTSSLPVVWSVSDALLRGSHRAVPILPAVRPEGWRWKCHCYCTGSVGIRLGHLMWQRWVTAAFNLVLPHMMKQAWSIVTLLVIPGKFQQNWGRWRWMLGITSAFALKWSSKRAQQLSDCCSYCLTLHASFSLSFLSSLISSSLSFSLVNNFNQIFRKVFPVPLKNSSVSLTFTMRVGGKNKPQANHC